MRISGRRNWALASSKFSLRTQATYSGANFIWGGSPQANQVGHEAIRPDGPGWQLAPEPEANVHPAAFADPRFDQGTGLDALVELERIRRGEQVHVALIAVAQEVEAALLHPPVPRLRPEPVGRGEHRMRRLEHLDRSVLVGH